MTPEPQPKKNKKPTQTADIKNVKIKEIETPKLNGLAQGFFSSNDSSLMSGAGAANANAGFSSSFNAIAFWSIAILSLFLAQMPIIGLLFAPVTQFTTMVHELSHAIVCIATGGYVSGMTIVGDGAGHGGLTNCYGGWPFLYTQAGYLGTAVFGSFLIFVGQYPRFSKYLLILLGVITGFASIVLIGGNIFSTGLAGFGSFLWGVAMSAGLIFAGLKLKPNTANLLLVFLGIQTALNSFTGVLYLVQMYFGFIPTSAGWSDATSMSQMPPFLPAIIWSLFWFLSSAALLTYTVWHSYGKRLFKVSPKSKLLSG